MRKNILLLITAMLLLVAAPVVAQDDEGDGGEASLPDFINHTECEVDLSGQNIDIFHLGDISSPGYSPITLPLVAGLDDATAYFNERGGVCGATMGQTNFDTGGDPARTSAGYEQLKAENPDLLVLYSSQDSELLRPTLAEDEIPVLISAGSIPGLYGENADEPGWIYATNPVYADQFAMFCEYVGNNPEEFSEEPVIGYMGWGGPLAAFGLGAFTDASISYCEEQGVEVIDEAETFLSTATSTEVSTLVENHINRGATILYVNALASGPVRVAEAVEFIGFSDELTLASVNWGMDTSAALLSRDSLGADGLPVINGMYGSLPFRWWSETEDPGISLLQEQAEANDRGVDTRGISYILGWSIADTYIEMYTLTANRIAEEQGLEDGEAVLEAIDGAAIRETIESMDYAPLDLYTINYQDGAIRALPNNRIVQLRFPNEDRSGIAESGDGAFKVPLDDGTNYFPAVIVPKTDFRPAPDTVSMMAEEE